MKSVQLISLNVDSILTKIEKIFLKLSYKFL